MSTVTACPSPSRPSPKREAVLDAAQRLFLDQGYAATSMDQVAALAAVSKATIYAHFPSKEDLFGAIIRRRCDCDLVSIDQPDMWEGDARTVLTRVADHLHALFLAPETLAMYRVVVAESLRQPELAQAFYDAGPGQGKDRLAEMFRRLGERGELTVSDPWRLADQLTGMLRGDLLMRALLGLPQAEGRTGDKVVADAVEVILKACAPCDAGPAPQGQETSASCHQA